jgi:hypothetical protein
MGYSILHVLTQMDLIYDGVAVDDDGNKYWFTMENFKYKLFPLSDEMYDKFYDARKEYCNRSGSPLFHGDPITMRPKNHVIGNDDKGVQIVIGYEAHEFVFDVTPYHVGEPLVIEQDEMTNLNCSLEIVHLT